MDTNVIWSIVIIILSIQVEVLFIWFLVWLTKRVIKEIRMIRRDGYRSANWTLLVWAFLFAAGFIGSMISALLGFVY